jgi:hypothetical protein
VLDTYPVAARSKIRGGERRSASSLFSNTGKGDGFGHQNGLYGTVRAHRTGTLRLLNFVAQRPACAVCGLVTLLQGRPSSHRVQASHRAAGALERVPPAPPRRRERHERVLVSPDAWAIVVAGD